jgi:2,4-dienoyl-CoA reductase-like NADH-dependent reductase (Old Yellow Enzyme family)
VTPANDAGLDSDPQALFNHVVEGLAPLKLAYIHVIEGATGGARDVAPFDYEALRRRYRQDHPSGAWVVNNGYTREMALEAIASGRADAVAFGKPFISNPDLVARLRPTLRSHRWCAKRSTAAAPPATPTTRRWRADPRGRGAPGIFPACPFAGPGDVLEGVGGIRSPATGASP